MQIIINGLIAGLAVAQLALAFQVVYLPTGVFFVGLASLYVVAPYIYSAVQRLGMAWQLCATISIAVVVSIALLFEILNHAPLTRKGASGGAHLISSLGIYILLVQVITMTWGNNTMALRPEVHAVYHFAGSVVADSQVIMTVAAGALLLGFLAMLHTTALGLHLRALADNPTQFALYGYNVSTFRLIAFGLSGLLAATASLLTAYDIGYTPNGGLPTVLLAVVAVIIGGRTSFFGPIIGGLLLGFVRAEVVWQFSARWQEAFTYAILALFLLSRPRGIFSRTTRIEEID
ncbi:MAG: branched-chain amino acid ABC transporter permease [Syntrophorhabdales bacterium]|jgi:branched-chain amino acid transport system permease protein